MFAEHSAILWDEKDQINAELVIYSIGLKSNDLMLI